MEEIKRIYLSKREEISAKLNEFRNLNEKDYLNELLFCTLTPQSNAKRCWEAVLELNKIRHKNKMSISKALKGKARFHNNKARYILLNLEQWNKIKNELNNPDIYDLRNWLAENVNGFGLKEASHFLRNIGKSSNKVAILDRHILKNLKLLGIVEDENIKSRKMYFETEKKFIDFSKQIGISIDELDLVFWSKENGEIFK